MREIKFRGKSIDTDGWVYGDYSTSIENGDNGGTEVYYEEINTVLTYINNQLVYPETLGQYTGLKDRKGIEIYEGDLCKELDKNNKEIGSLLQILWSEYYQFRAKVIIGGTLSKGLSFPLWHWDKRKENGYRQLEVIGNIYENPELLKEGE